MGLFNKKKKEETKEMNQQDTGVVTIYTGKAKLNDLSEIASRLFKEQMDSINVVDEESFTVNFFDQSWIRFSVVSEPNEIYKQTTGMVNFFSQAPLANEEVKKSALQQISLFNHIIGVVFSLDEDEMRTKFIYHAMFMLAKEITGFVLLPSMYLLHSSGKLLISIDGKTDYDVFYPEVCSDLLDKDVEPGLDDIKRQQHTIEILKGKGIPYAEHLKLAAIDATTTLHSKEEIVKRLIATFTTCVQAEVYTCGRYDDPKQMMNGELELLDNKYGVKEYFSEEEQDYLEHAEQYKDKHGLFDGRYECCAVFMWALSLMDLQEPDQICDASKLGEIIWNNDLSSLMKKAVLKSKQEVLDFWDLVFRYDWACVDARIHGSSVTGLESSIVYFWHYAMNWLLQVDDITDWDKIQPNT